MKNYELAVCVMILGAFLCGSLVGASVQERKDRAILEELQQQIEVMNKPLAAGPGAYSGSGIIGGASVNCQGASK